MAGPSALPPPGPGFEARKSKILEQLAVPDAEYTDASPKGTVDVGIRPLLGKVNAAEGFVTTSSCAGRVSVFVEGRKASQQQQPQTATTGGEAAATEEDQATMDIIQPATTQTVAGLGGKGGGGTWLYVSHDPHPLAGKQGVDWVQELGLAGDAVNERLFDGASGSEGCGSERRLIHFKFEPMVSDIAAADAGSQPANPPYNCPLSHIELCANK